MDDNQEQYEFEQRMHEVAEQRLNNDIRMLNDLFGKNDEKDTCEGVNDGN